MKKTLLLLFVTSSLYAGGLTTWPGTGTVSTKAGTGSIQFTPSVATGSSGFTYRRTITISSANVMNVYGTLTDFPVLVSTTNVAYSTAAAGGKLANANGFDLIFSTADDCSYKMNWDTETVNNSGSVAMNVWVKVPVLTTATLTAATFYMCYGNSGVTTYQGVSTGTWDSNFKAVWHYSNGSALSLNDSTYGANTSTNSNTTATTGQIGVAASFTGDYSIGSHLSVPWTMTPDFTAAIEAGTVSFCAWLYPTSLESESGVMGVGGTSSEGLNMAIFSGNLSFWYSGGSMIQTTGDISADAWTYVCGVASSLSSLNIYFNGDLVKTGSSALGSFTLTPINNLFIVGAYGSLQSYGVRYPGYIDELRISGSARNSDWIKTEYNNQSAPTTFSTIGSETTE